MSTTPNPLSTEQGADQGGDNHAPQTSVSGSVSVMRAAMANFLVANKALIKARFRAQIESTADGANDSSDFFASLVRRIDRRLASGAIDQDAAEFLQQLYLETMMDHARAHRRAGQELRLTGMPGVRGDTPGADREAPDVPRQLRRTLESVNGALSEQDEQIIRLRAAGLSHKAVAHVLGLRPATVRQRWSRLLRAQAEAESAVTEAGKRPPDRRYDRRMAS